MRAVALSVMFGMVVLIAGCVPSLHPLFTEKDLVFDPALVGRWAEEKGESTWVLKKSGDKSYELTYREKKGMTGKFEAHLVQFGAYRFLDIYPQELDIKNDFYKLHLIPAHTFSRVWVKGDALQIAMLDPGWLARVMARGGG